MNVFQYFSTSAGRAGNAFGFCFEHKADLENLVDEIADKGIVTVTKLRSVDDGKGGRLITGRERIAIGVNSISTIQVAATPHWEAPSQVQAAA